MLTLYKMFLFWANRHSGAKVWWVLFAFGVALLVFALVTAAPILAMLFDDNFVGVYSDSGGLIAYGMTLPRDYENAYFMYATALWIAIAKIGVVMIQTGVPLARGYIFIYPPPGGILNGNWVKP